jgi:hypothetical protein
VEWVAESPWNQWPDVHGIGGRMAVESALSRMVLITVNPASPDEPRR